MTMTIRIATRAVAGLALTIQSLTPAAVDQADLSLPADVPNRAGCLSAASATSFTGDISGDGYVNVGDLQLLVATWGKTFGTPGFNPEADFNCDAYVNVGDLQLLVFNWGAHP